MNKKRWFWFVSVVTGVLILFALLGSVTQTALMQNDEPISRRTAVSPQSPANGTSQGGDTAVNTQSVSALIPDGSFENTPSLWTEADNTNGICSPRIGDWQADTGVPAFDGTQYFWGGDYCVIDAQTKIVNSNSASISLTLPTETPVISFWYWAQRTDPDTREDFAYVKVNDGEVWNYELTRANNTNGWVKETLDLSNFAGQTITLEFSVLQGTTSAAGSMFFDFVEFTDSAEQTWTVNPRSGGFFQYQTASGQDVTDLTIPPGAVDKETIISYKSAFSPGFPLYPAEASPLGVSLKYAGIAFDLDAYDEFVYLPLIINNNASVAKAENNHEAVSTESIEATNSFQFNSPIKVTIHYDVNKLEELGIPADALFLYYWTGDGWQDAAFTCAPEDYIDPPSTTYIRDFSNQSFTLHVCHFTRFGTVGVN